MTKSEAITALYAVFNAPHNADINIAYLNKILDDLVAAEREKCAMEADYEAARWPYAPEAREPCEEIAKAIRSRT